MSDFVVENKKTQKFVVIETDRLCIGNPCILIMQNNNKVQTSNIVDIKLDQYGNIYQIETLNTIYINEFANKKDLAYSEIVTSPTIGEKCVIVDIYGNIIQTSDVIGLRYNLFDQGYEIATKNTIYKKRALCV